MKGWPSTETLSPRFYTVSSTTVSETGVAGVSDLEKIHSAEKTLRMQGEMHEDLVCVRDHVASERLSEAIR